MSSTLSRGVVASVILLLLSFGFASTALADNVTTAGSSSGNTQSTSSSGTAEKPNNGGFSKSSEARHKAIDCANILTLVQWDQSMAQQADRNHDAAAAAGYYKDVDLDTQMGTKRGCWS